MSQDILVVEYEPRYTERVRQALNGQMLQPVFARDGDEALRALENTNPKLIVVSSMLPKMTSADLIKQIRGKSGGETPPILLTITGYNGKSPQADAAKLGASDLLPKPYSSTEFLGKVRQMLGDEAPEMPAAWPTAEIHDELKQFETQAVSKPPSAAAPAARVNPLGDIDQMLAQTLSGLRIPAVKKTEGAAARTSSSLPDLEKLLEDTLSGLERKSQATVAAKAAAAPAAEPARPRMEAKWVAPVLPPDEPAHDPAKGEDFDDTQGTRFGQYLLTEKIAAGGMAEVWKAKMRGVEGFQKLVAIKKILPHLSDNAEFVDMFIDEAKLAAQLNHSNIIHIYDLGKIANSYFIAMEYIDGHDLKSILKRSAEKNQPLPVELALFITSKVAAALDYAHRKRDFDDKEMDLVHRDVSPQNVLISHEGDIKLCDFGIAKAASKASHTLSGALKGKLQYMSPEQAWGRKIDRRSDIFALGIVLFELLTGKRLFSGDNELSILEQVRQAKTVAPSTVNEEVTPEIDAIVLKALQREAENRYQTAGEMAKDLDAIVYNFWPTPTSADLAIYMHHLYVEEPPAATAGTAPAEEPVVMPPFDASERQSAEPAQGTAQARSADRTAAVGGAAAAKQTRSAERAATVNTAVDVATAAAPVSAQAPFSQAVDEESPRRLPVAAIVAGLIVVAGLAAGGYYFYQGQSAPQPAAAAATSSAPSAQAARPNTAMANEPSTGAIAPAAMASIDPAAAAAADDARIDEEVQRRLDAERQRLEALRAQQQRAGAQSAAAPPQTQTRPPLTATAAPIPVTETIAPPAVAQEIPTPIPTPVPTPAVVQASPPPVQAPQQVPQQPEREPIKPGDLVAAGTDGLVAPELIKQYKPPYPPMAKAQKVEGVVVVQVLVSETGKVLNVKVLRGVSQNVGINEAAMEAARRSTFRPASVNGVKVKAYKNLTVPFKL